MNPLPPGITNVGYEWLYNRRVTQGIAYYLMFTRYGFNVIYSDVGSNRQYFAQDTSSMLDVYGIFGSYDAIVAWITPPTVTITINATQGGTTIPPPGPHTFTQGELVTGITAYPDPGYVFESWSSDLPGVDPYANPVSLIAYNGYLTANFSGAPPAFSNVTISVQGQGAADPAVGSYPGTWHVGEDLIVSATAEPGWRYEKMLRNGAEWTSANPGEFLNLRETENVEVIFVQEVPPPQPSPALDLAVVGGALLAAVDATLVAAAVAKAGGLI